jgi:hypothetical protein
MTIQERKIMQYPQIKKRMVELVKILKKNTREKKNWWTQLVRKKLAKLIKTNKLAWLEVKKMTYKGYKINLRPYKIGVGVWNLEIEKKRFYYW